jgi:uncharacterized protein YdeI (YjbR/CyaY-like superfamily)
MGKKDERVDAYINKAGNFAKPILRHIRQLIHAACPQVEEAMKWRYPSYLYRGILCITPAFKQHCAVVFWHGAIRDAINKGKAKDAWGNLGRIGKFSDLPKDSVLTRAIKESMKLNEVGKKQKVPKSAKRRLAVPGYFTKALGKNRKALTNFKGMSPSHQREYVEWIAEAKREETREKRLAVMLQMLSEGKTRNWKYER